MGYIAVVISLIAIYLMANKKIGCWYVWILSNVCWVTYGIIIQSTPVILMDICYFVANLYGLRKWRKDLKPKLQDDERIGTCECIEDFGIKLGYCDWCEEGKVVKKRVCACNKPDDGSEHFRRFIHKEG